jgi:hypothetical protein
VECDVSGGVGLKQVPINHILLPKELRRNSAGTLLEFPGNRSSKSEIRTPQEERSVIVPLWLRTLLEFLRKKKVIVRYSLAPYTS